MRQLVLRIEVGNEAFQLTYIDSLALLAQYTTALALFLMTAHATAYGRQVALGTDNTDGITQVSHRQLVNPVRDIVADGASFLTLWHLAVQTSFRLVNSLEHGIALVYFLECFIH